MFVHKIQIWTTNEVDICSWGRTLFCCNINKINMPLVWRTITTFWYLQLTFDHVIHQISERKMKAWYRTHVYQFVCMFHRKTIKTFMSNFAWKNYMFSFTEITRIEFYTKIKPNFKRKKCLSSSLCKYRVGLHDVMGLYM